MIRLHIRYSFYTEEAQGYVLLCFLNYNLVYWLIPLKRHAVKAFWFFHYVQMYMYASNLVWDSLHCSYYSLSGFDLVPHCPTFEYSSSLCYFTRFLKGIYVNERFQKIPLMTETAIVTFDEMVGIQMFGNYVTALLTDLTVGSRLSCRATWSNPAFCSTFLPRLLKMQQLNMNIVFVLYTIQYYRILYDVYICTTWAAIGTYTPSR